MDPHYSSGSGSKASIGGHPIHPMLVPLPIGFFTGALICDVTYWVSGDLFWARAAFWLIAGALTTGVLAAVAGLIEIMGVKRAKKMGMAWAHGLGNVAAMVIGAVNCYARVDDVGAVVVPMGLTLSVITMAILGVTAWLGGELSFRHGIGVSRNVGSDSHHL